MKKITRQEHPAAAMFTMLLFGIYVLFIMLMLLFSAKAYHTSVESKEENSNLHTAAAYVASKFHQHDEREDIFAEKFEGLDALCFRDEINGEEYVTRIYLQDTELKELFSAADASAGAGMGMVIAELKDFTAVDEGNGFFRISMEDCNGKTSSFLLHGGPAGNGWEAIV